LLSNYEDLKHVKIQGAQNFFIEKWRQLSDQMIKTLKLRTNKFQIYNFTTSSLFTFFQYGVTFYIAFSVWQKRITLGSFSALTQSIFSFTTQFRRLFDAIINLNKYNNYFRIIGRAKNLETKLFSSTKLILDQKKPHLIEFKNLTFNYPNCSHKVLDNISLKINPQEKVAFLGPNGSGKSTLINILLGLYDIAQGQLFIDGLDINNYELDSLSRNFAVLMQNQSNYSLSIAENIDLGKNSSKQQIISCLKQGGIWEKIVQQPQGIATFLTRSFAKRGMSLSGGENQRLNLSRLFNNTSAPIVIVDEFERWLDLRTTKEIWENILHFSKDKTLIMITHHQEIIPLMDHVYQFEEGKIIKSVSAGKQGTQVRI
jgi:ABC-type bacteriocin/lantibiotic exporter with double-glycine peptidase domain